uniref:F-box protein 46 n=1 Tax=Petromyzon marinus TaxID=7757 RepID=S4RR21_PETMA
AAAAAAHNGEEQRVQLDILSVIKPGNTREKIAFFIRNQCNSWNGQLKVKNPWEQGCTKAKRRRKSQDSDVASAQNARSVSEAACQCSTSAFKEPDGRMANACSDGLESCNENVLSESDMLSVLEKVALLEGKSAREGVGRSRVGSSSSAHASDAAAASQEPDLQKHSLDAACSPPVSCSPSACGELPAESVRVTEAIARLELESLKQQQPGDRTSCSLSRNSSLRRSFKKISISSSAASCSSASAASQPARVADATDTFSAEALAGEDCSLSLASSPAVQTSPSNDRCTLTAGATVENFVQISSTPASPAVVDSESKIDHEKGPFCSQLVASAEGQSPVDVVCQDPKVCKTSPSLCVALSSVCKSLCTRVTQREWPSLACRPPAPYGSLWTVMSPGQRSRAPIALSNEGSSLADLIPGQLFLLAAPAVSEKGSEKSLAPALSEVTSEEQSSPKLSPSKSKKAVSHEFLETRFRIQQLLEPRQYMLSLPDHVLAQMFGYLPTRCLAALKCTCRDFKWLIEAYDIRATDSRWSDDPRYSDDPCKQCRKRYQRGDVSLCRWHPKPYHRDLLYGRSYWMCCRKPDRDAAGCKVGLHDNNWV